MSKHIKIPADSGRAYAGRSPSQRRTARREALLAAGLQVFGRDGFHGTTIKSICSQAGLTERYFYESFANSEDLFVAVYRRCVARLEADLERAADGHVEPEQIVKAGLDTFFRSIHDPCIARVLLIEIFGISAEVDRTYRATALRFAALTEQAIERIYDLGRLAPDSDRRFLSIGLVGSTIHIAMYWALGSYRESLETVVASSLELYRAMGASLGRMS